jgi:hypothetical protein
MASLASAAEQKLWSAEGIRRMLDHEIQYKDWKFIVQERKTVSHTETVAAGVQFAIAMEPDLRLRAEWDAPDAATGKMEKQQSRWWPLSRHMVKTEIIQTAFLCVLKAEEHEISEAFNYFHHSSGEWTSPFNSHIDIDTLARASQVVDVRTDPRSEAPANQRRE